MTAPARLRPSPAAWPSRASRSKASCSAVRLPSCPASRRQKAGSPAAVVMITHQTTEAAIRKALAAIERDGHVDAKPQMIRIEKL